MKKTLNMAGITGGDSKKKKPQMDYTLYLVTDRDLMSSATVEESVEQAILGGCTVVQLREKDVTDQEFFQLARRVKAITSKHKVPLIINDRVDIAKAIDAEGVHVGQSDESCISARKALGKDKIVGVSASNLSESLKAVEDGADYLGVGAMFATSTKTDANITSMEELKRIRDQVDIPIVVIGGINKKTIPLFKGTGIDGLAVVSAIVAQQDVRAAANEIKDLFQKTVKTQHSENSVQR